MGTGKAQIVVERFGPFLEPYYCATCYSIVWLNEVNHVHKIQHEETYCDKSHSEKAELKNHSINPFCTCFFQAENKLLHNGTGCIA